PPSPRSLRRRPSVPSGNPQGDWTGVLASLEQTIQLGLTEMARYKDHTRLQRGIESGVGIYRIPVCLQLQSLAFADTKFCCLLGIELDIGFSQYFTQGRGSLGQVTGMTLGIASDQQQASRFYPRL